MSNNVVSLQINTADIMAMNRVDRIVLDPIRTYACTRAARTGVRVIPALLDVRSTGHTTRQPESGKLTAVNAPGTTGEDCYEGQIVYSNTVVDTSRLRSRVLRVSCSHLEGPHTSDV